MAKKEILEFGLMAASPVRTTIGLLGAEITEAQIYDAHSAHRVRLEEIERRILAIEARLAAQPL